MILTTYLLAVLGLLATPGPTNTLMGVAGAEGGLGRVLALLPAALAGYLLAVAGLALFGAAVLARWPAGAAVVTAAAAAWVMVLAARLWRRPVAAVGGVTVTTKAVFVTTLLNPKALIVGLVLLPAPSSPAFPGRLALFAVLVAAVALGWGASGSLLRRGGADGRRLAVLQKVASAFLAVVSLTMLAGLLRV